MSTSTQSFVHVRMVFDPYHHGQVQTLLKKVYQDFGRDKSRWFYKSSDPEDLDINCWVLDFVFRDPHDATFFAVKYLK